MWFQSKHKTGKDAPARPVGSLGERSEMQAAGYSAEGGRRNQYPPQRPSSSAYEQEDYLPPPGPPPSLRRPAREQEEYLPPPGPPPSALRTAAHSDSAYGREEYLPPPGPPPSTSRTAAHHDSAHGREEYLPPPGPPPPTSRTTTHYDSAHGPEEYLPPPGPPPSSMGARTYGQQDEYAPPPGPPPSASSYDWTAPPPTEKNAQQLSAQHDWQEAVPDTSLFPPPPAIFSGFDISPANNAEEEQAEAGEEWCRRYPLSRPMVLDQTGKGAQHFHNIRLVEPAGFSGRLHQLSQGIWEVHTFERSPDRCVIGYPPLYSVHEHDPTVAGRGPKTIYYEVRMLPRSGSANLAMGFTALPYPSFRLPGWHRGSLAVHGDDGHKYINDRWGGKSFTEPFVNRPSTTYGIGMTFFPQTSSKEQQQHRPRVEIFLTRDGAKVGAWDLHEETDAEQDLPVTGLEGFHDLSCAVGAFGAVRFEVVFEPSRWLYVPRS